jgi:hypothetical protein
MFAPPAPCRAALPFSAAAGMLMWGLCRYRLIPARFDPKDRR